MHLFSIECKKVILLVTAVTGFVFYANALVMQHREAGVEKAFKAIIHKYASDKSEADKLWKEVSDNYSGKDRYYHTLEHLDNFYTQLNKCKKEVQDWETMVLAMVYHDVIYNSADHKDEERSADLAVKRLQEIGYPDNKIEKCKELVLATKTHAYTADNDTNLFNDADMSILGLDRDVYNKYVKDVRLEYASSPQFDAGRKKILQYFLSMDKIFKTPFFNALYEMPARENIAREISTLP